MFYLNTFLTFLTCNFIIFGLCFASPYLSVNRVLYDQSGAYTLKPEDYNYSDNVFISISGAGSGSTHFSQDSITWYCPGNSGSFVSFNLLTYNRTFTFTLGEGGYSILELLNNSYYHSNANGNYSSFTIADSKGEELLLIVPGGNSNGTSSRPTFYREIRNNQEVDDLHKREVDDLYKRGNQEVNDLYKREVDDLYKREEILRDFIRVDGVVFNCYAWNNIPNNGYGAYSKFGHEGGNINATPKCDGYLGSGSGYNCCYCMVDEHNTCIRPYKGGDGALLIYF